MNLMKLLSTVILIAFLFTSCVKENIDIKEDPVVEIPAPEVIQFNPLLNKTAGSESGEGQDIKCFTIVYPFNLLLEDGSEVNVSSNEEFKNWTNDDSNFIVDFIYPLNVKTQTEGTVVMNTNIGLSDLFISCIPDEGWGEDQTGEGVDYGFPVFDINFQNSCFELVYPITITNLEDSISVANNAVELSSIVANEPGLTLFVFPINIVYEDGDTEVIGSSDLLSDEWFLCDRFNLPIISSINTGGQIACYLLKFPIEVETSSGIIKADTEDLFFSLLYSGQITDFVYPLNLIAFNGSELIINSQEAFNAALYNCYFDITNPDVLAIKALRYGYLEGCYSINYPIIVVNEEGVLKTIDNDEELYDSIILSDFITQHLLFPVDVTSAVTQGEIVFNDKASMIEFILYCQ